MKILCEAKGLNGQLTVFEDKIVISRKGIAGFIQHYAKGEKDIYIEHLTGIQLKEASTLFHGYIQFVFGGSVESKGSRYDARKDENSIVITKSQNLSFKVARQIIETQISKIKRGRQEQPEQKRNELDDIEKLAILKDKGVITEEEFTAKKRQLLGL